jgi:drug/metabolite transporter (DMT)-like permease
MDRQTRGTLEMTIAMTVLGSIGWLVVVSGQPAAGVVFWRCVFGAAALFVICGTQGLLRGHMTARIFGIAALGGVAIVVNWVLLFAAFAHASISVSTAIYNTQPFMLVVMGALFLGERLTATRLAWLALAFTGVLLLVQARPEAGYTGGGFIAGVLLALAAAFFYAVATLVAKKLAGTPPQLVVLVQVCVGIALLAPFTDFADLPASARSWGALVVLGAVHTGLVYILFYGAIQKLPTHLTGALSFIYPVAAIAVDYLAFGVRLQPMQAVGAATILFAAAGTTLGWSLPRRRATAAARPPNPAPPAPKEGCATSP